MKHDEPVFSVNNDLYATFPATRADANQVIMEIAEYCNILWAHRVCAFDRFVEDVKVSHTGTAWKWNGWRCGWARGQEISRESCKSTWIGYQRCLQGDDNRSHIVIT